MRLPHQRSRRGEEADSREGQFRLLTSAATRERGSVLIIVLWVAFGLVSLAIYFANSSSLELRAADNRVATLEAEQAIAGAARYLSCPRQRHRTRHSTRPRHAQGQGRANRHRALLAHRPTAR